MVDIPKHVSRAQVISSTIIQLESGTTISDIIQAVANSDYSVEDAQVEREFGGYGCGDDTWNIVGYREETEDEIKIRTDLWVKQYEESMAEINAKAEKKRAQRQDKDWKEFQRLKKKFGNQ